MLRIDNIEKSVALSDIQEEMKNFYLKQSKKFSPDIDLENSEQAAMFLSDNMVRWNLKLIENFRAKVTKYDEYSFEIE